MAVPAGSTQFVLPGVDVSSSSHRVNASCYLPQRQPSAPAAGAEISSTAVWRTMINLRGTTITTPPEATSAQNGRVLTCLRQAGLTPTVLAGAAFKTD
jgi:hypothetical protein